MSSDNGLLVKKNPEMGTYDVYYLCADNSTYLKTFTDLETMIRYIQKEQEASLLEYGTRFEGF